MLVALIASFAACGGSVGDVIKTATGATRNATATGTGTTGSGVARDTASARARTTPSTRDATNTYTDTKGRFSFRIPKGWRVQRSRTANVAVEVVTDMPHGIFRVATEAVPTPGTATVNEYTTALIAGLKKSTAGFELGPGGVQDVTLGGHPAQRFEWIETDRGTRLRVLSYVVLKEQTSYALFIAAEPDSFGTIVAQTKVSIDTFTFR